MNGAFAIAKQGRNTLNYRHAFHAGNFADVHKHALLARLVLAFQRKDKAFRVYDTHAGIGRYDLSADASTRTGEYRTGIARLLESDAANDLLLAPYVGCVLAEGSTDGALRFYPGSPVLIRQLLRPQDRLSAYELHPQDARSLAELFAGDVQTKAIHLDGWLALNAHLPPKERRGLVLIDPPYEEPGEFERIVDRLVRAHRRWPGGTYAVWYPIKKREAVAAFHASLSDSGIADIIACDLRRQAAGAVETLIGSGLVVVNPPYGFQEEARQVMERLLPVLALDTKADCGINVLAPERS